MRVLVTGGRGFIGSELLPIIQNAAHDVYSLERRPASSAEQSENRVYRIKEGDIIKTSQIRHIIREIQPEILIHLAALSSVTISYDHPIEYIATNIAGTVNLAEACLNEVNNFKKMIFTSSIYVYKDTPNILQNEDKTPEEPNTPFGITKLAAEKYLLSLSRNYKFPAFILRLSTIYGRKRGRPYSIVEKLITQMLEGKNESKVGYPDAVRDFMYVSDAVNACVKLMESTSIDPGQVFNISTSNPTTVKELAERVRANIGSKNEINWNSCLVTPRTGDPKWLVADNTKAKKFLNWEPKVCLDEGIQKIIAIYR